MQHGRIIPSCWNEAWCPALAFSSLYILPFFEKSYFANFPPIFVFSDWLLWKCKGLPSCHTQHITEVSSSFLHPAESAKILFTLHCNLLFSSAHSCLLFFPGEVENRHKERMLQLNHYLQAGNKDPITGGWNLESACPWHVLAVSLLIFSSVVKCGFMPLEEHTLAIVHISHLINIGEIVI